MAPAWRPSVGETTISSSGTDHSTTPKPKSAAMRCRRASTRATKPPMIPPTPSTELSRPTPDSPSSSRSRAMLTSYTERGAGDDRLGRHQPGDEPQLAVAGDGLGSRPATRGGSRRRLGSRRPRPSAAAAVGAGIARPAMSAADDEERHGVDEVDDLDVGDRQQEAAERRAERRSRRSRSSTRRRWRSSARADRSPARAAATPGPDGRRARCAA